MVTDLLFRRKAVRLIACLALVVFVCGCIGPMRTIHSAKEVFIVTPVEVQESVEVKIKGFNFELRNDTDYYSQVVLFVALQSGGGFDSIGLSVGGAREISFNSSSGLMGALGVQRIAIDKQDYRVGDSAALSERINMPFSQIAIFSGLVPVTPFEVQISGRLVGGGAFVNQYRVASVMQYKTRRLPFFENWFS